jgi:hypothetical protein
MSINELIIKHFAEKMDLDDDQVSINEINNFCDKQTKQLKRLEEISPVNYSGVGGTVQSQYLKHLPFSEDYLVKLKNDEDQFMLRNKLQA